MRTACTACAKVFQSSEKANEHYGLKHGTVCLPAQSLPRMVPEAPQIDAVAAEPSDHVNVHWSQTSCLCLCHFGCDCDTPKQHGHLSCNEPKCV